MSGITQLYGFARSALAPVGQQAYTAPGTYTWVAPAGVTSVSVVAVGAAWVQAGALSYKNNISVTSGASYTVKVPNGPSSYCSAPYTNICYSPAYFKDLTTVVAGRYTYRIGDGGGNGGVLTSGGAGGAGGYSGNGGNGGSNGAGGGGGGGGTNPCGGGGGGGGVGLLGQGASGVAGTAGSGRTFGSGGTGGSGGGNGGCGVIQCGAPFWVNCGTSGLGGSYGGAGFGGCYGRLCNAAVRIIWGPGRAFPSTNTGNL